MPEDDGQLLCRNVLKALPIQVVHEGGMVDGDVAQGVDLP